MSIEENARQFAGDLQFLLRGCLPTSRAVRSVVADGRIVVRPGTLRPVNVPLKIKGRPVALLSFNYELMADSTGNYPSVVGSRFQLVAISSMRPIVRCEFQKSSHSAPKSHWHVHGESTELGRLLATGSRASSRLQDLHLPTGGSRFRPTLEDFLQFLINDAGVDHQPGYKKVIQQAREKWRRTQVAVAVRDAPASAAEALRELGYSVTPPVGQHGPDRHDRLHEF